MGMELCGLWARISKWSGARIGLVDVGNKLSSSLKDGASESGMVLTICAGIEHRVVVAPVTELRQS